MSETAGASTEKATYPFSPACNEPSLPRLRARGRVKSTMQRTSQPQSALGAGKGMLSRKRDIVSLYHSLKAFMHDSKPTTRAMWSFKTV